MEINRGERAASQEITVAAGRVYIDSTSSPLELIPCADVKNPPGKSMGVNVPWLSKKPCPLPTGIVINSGDLTLTVNPKGIS
jgi:hypothetical protein